MASRDHRIALETGGNEIIRKILMRYVVPIVQHLFPHIEIDDRLLSYLDREITYSFDVIGGWKHCDELEQKILTVFAKENPVKFLYSLKNSWTTISQSRILNDPPSIHWNSRNFLIP